GRQEVHRTKRSGRRCLTLSMAEFVLHTLGWKASTPGCYARALPPWNPKPSPPFLIRCVPPSTASIKKSSTCSKTLASLQKLPKNFPSFFAISGLRDSQRSKLVG